MRRSRQSNAPELTTLAESEYRSPSAVLRKFSRHDLRNPAQTIAVQKTLRELTRSAIEQYTDIGEIPPVDNLERRMKCKQSLRIFCETYFGDSIFYRKWSKNTERLIEALEQTLIYGGDLCFVMPRGEGKTSCCKAALLYTALYGYKHNFIVGCADTDFAIAFLNGNAGILRLFLENKPLTADFPEWSIPLKQGEKMTRLVLRYHGEPLTPIVRRLKRLSIPPIEGYPNTGVNFFGVAAGGKIRGIQELSNNKLSRIDCVFLDDFQTRKTATSPQKTDDLLSWAEADAKYCMKGAERPSFIAAGTIIKSGDFYDTLMTRPGIVKIRTQSISKFPDTEKENITYEGSKIHQLALWREWYATWIIDRDAGNKMYKKWKRQLEQGVKYSEVQYDDNVYPSALAYLMADYFYRPEVFVSENQNNPNAFAGSNGDSFNFNAQTIQRNFVKPSDLPTHYEYMTCGIDVQTVLGLMYGVIIGWHNGHCYFLDAQMFPKQAITGRNMAQSYKPMFPVSNGGALALKEFVTYLRTLQYSGHTIDSIFVDCGGTIPDQIHAAVKELNVNVSDATGKGKIHAVKGWANNSFGARDMSEWTGKNIIFQSPGICEKYVGGKNIIHRVTLLDSNKMKCELAQAISTDTMKFVPKVTTPAVIESLISEQYEIRESLETKVIWKPKVVNADNDIWDATVYAVAAFCRQARSMLFTSYGQKYKEPIKMK